MCSREPSSTATQHDERHAPLMCHKAPSLVKWALPQQHAEPGSRLVLRYGDLKLGAQKKHTATAVSFPCTLMCWAKSACRAWQQAGTGKNTSCTTCCGRLELCAHKSSNIIHSVFCQQSRSADARGLQTGVQGLTAGPRGKHERSWHLSHTYSYSSGAMHEEHRYFKAGNGGSKTHKHG